ncbi:hypothetical protein ACVXG8_23045 [Escherichia coli]
MRHDGRHAHDYDYVHRVRDIEADTPHVITPIRIGYLNLLVAPGSWPSLRYV